MSRLTIVEQGEHDADNRGGRVPGPRRTTTTATSTTALHRDPQEGGQGRAPADLVRADQREPHQEEREHGEYSAEDPAWCPAAVERRGHVRQVGAWACV